MKYLIQADSKELPNIEAALKIMDPEAEIVANRPDLALTVTADPAVMEGAETPFSIAVHLHGQDDGFWETRDREILDPRYQREDRTQRRKELIRLGIVTVLGRYFRRRPPWGILSGVRPTKIFHYLRDKGFTAPEIREKLIAIYGLIPGNADLLIQIGLGQERFFQPGDVVGIYAGIPFCPTRCHYCSFAAVSLETHRHLIPGFLSGLQRETEALGRLIREMGFRVETIYLGGGTPTSLDDRAFAEFLRTLRGDFQNEALREFTVEAGRPETINPRKIEAMVEQGVTRISINPQSMNQDTLDRIGRCHSIGAVAEAVRLVKTQSGLRFNMDLILGLPGEGPDLFLDSLRRVMQFQPDNITIHALAPKKAASWRRRFAELPLTAAAQLRQAAQEAQEMLVHDGYQPYYLYRQRAIVGDLENIGFARPGSESVYNIQMMEERQTIFGLGAGAVTKWVTRPDFRVYRLQSPKCPATYYHTIADTIVKKDQQTRLLLG